MRPGTRYFIGFFVFISVAAATAFSADLTITSFAPYAGFTNITLQTAGNVIFSGGSLNLPALPPGTGQLTVQAGNDIIIQDGTSVTAGPGWSVSLLAGANSNAPGTVVPGNGNVTLQGAATLAGTDGSISILAGNGVTVGSGYIDTTGGGGISVVAVSGSVNAGTGQNGFIFQNNPANPCIVSPNPGGISTAAGGNVTINAGGDVTSFLPYGTQGMNTAADAGTGAFGPEAGNVTITAGGNVYGHYVLANGTGTIAAQDNVGGQVLDDYVALSLIKGAWSVNATNGNIYLQEVRNPNGLYNNTTLSRGSHSPINPNHLFDYDPSSSVTLNAGVGVEFVNTPANLPRLSGVAIPVILPPSLYINAGPGGVLLDYNVTLFPSTNGELQINTTGGGSLSGAADTGSVVQLLMSDSGLTNFVNLLSFGDYDHGSAPQELNDPNPVIFNISGGIENLSLITVKETQITVGGDVDNSSFSGQNLHPTDVTTINVAGTIFNSPSFSSVVLPQAPTQVASQDLPPGVDDQFDTLIKLAVDPVALANLNVSQDSPAQLLSDWGSLLLVGNPVGNFSLPSGFAYDSTDSTLSFLGPMNQKLLNLFNQPVFTVIRFDNDGLPLVDGSGHFITDTYNTWVNASSLSTLIAESAATTTVPNNGLRIGGPGQLDVSAGSIQLGSSYGILSVGALDYGEGGGERYANLASVTPVGASVDVTAQTNINLVTSTIASLAGGNVSINCTGGEMDVGPADALLFANQTLPVGAFVTGSGSNGPGNLIVSAYGDVNIEGSRVAAYDGGNVTISSETGNVDAGSSGAAVAMVQTDFVNPTTGLPGSYTADIFGDGILATTLPNPSQAPYSPVTPGNITVTTPQGDIITDGGGILQEPLDGNTATGPTVTLTAGSQGFVGNIDLGDSGVIGESLVLEASGNIAGLLVISQANVAGAVSVSGANSQLFVTAIAGTNVQFSVTALNDAPLSYQWFENATSLPGETNAMLSLTNITRANAANYSIVVSNIYAVVTNEFQLHVLVPQLLSASPVQTNQTLSISFGDAGGGILTTQDIGTFVIQTSTNLVDWISANPSISTNTSGGLSFQVPIPTNGAGFYRVLSQ